MVNVATAPIAIRSTLSTGCVNAPRIDLRPDSTVSTAWFHQEAAQPARPPITVPTMPPPSLPLTHAATLSGSSLSALNTVLRIVLKKSEIALHGAVTTDA